MAVLSSRATTAIVIGGYLHITIPNGGAPTGFDSFRISVTDLQAGLQTQITTNAGNISTNTSDISTLQDITSREQYVDQVSPTFQFAQPANSIINFFNLRSSTVGATVIISGSTSGVIQSSTALTDGELYRVDKIVDSVAGQTITFTITGTVSAEIYYNKNTI